MSNEKPIFSCVKSKSSGKNEWVKPEPSITVAELKSWCEEQIKDLKKEKAEDLKWWLGTQYLMSKLLARFCKETPHD